MKKIEEISENRNYTAVNFGLLNELDDYSMVHPINGQTIDGKVFLKDVSDATGTEISFMKLPAGKDLGYFHIHNQVEETYIILSGSGDFQVDDDCFPVTEGSAVRVAPAGVRRMRNSGDTPMVYMVIQSKAGSLDKHTYNDGTRVQHELKW